MHALARTQLSCLWGWSAKADKSAVATVAKTKELRKRYEAKRPLFREFWRTSRSRLSFQRDIGYPAQLLACER